jgi:hypothetical protein
MSVGKKTGGRVPGSVNKATKEAREAIASFVDGNAYRLTEWLDQVANGITKEVLDDEGNVVGEEYVTLPNPAKAFDMFQSVVEYHVPKLARTEITGSDTQPVIIEHNINVFGQLLENIKASRQSQ